MTTIVLARWQFALTSVYHFFFIPLTLGLSILVALMETRYVRSGDETYKTMAKFWGKLFLINFAMGVVTGIVMEFQFGMNWSEYSRFVGDVFGAPLAIEALSAFFLESTFLGIWIFGWDRLPKGLHAASMWLVAIGSNLSALWILIANSFMQEPTGYALIDGRAVMTDFPALVFNTHVWYQFPHVLASGMTTAAFFVLGISAYHLFKDHKQELFLRSFRWSSIYGLIGVVLVIIIGHFQGQHMVKVQPMKMAAAEALWETEDPAALSLVSIVNEEEQRNTFSLRIPRGLSFLSYNRFEGEVRGIKDLQAEFEALYGEGDYIPPVTFMFWSFRLMVASGFLMAAISVVCLFLLYTGRLEKNAWLLRLLPIAILLPYAANSLGWLFTEIGRQPWIVYGLQRVEDAASPSVTGNMLIFSLISYTVLYALLMGVDIFLLRKYATNLHLLENEMAETEGHHGS